MNHSYFPVKYKDAEEDRGRTVWMKKASSSEAMNGRDDVNDGHEHDVVMPGFRFHPTEEELVEFYLRWKVEGRRFNVDLISYLDLYRYDPWELPAFATIGEKEWFFYVPRDRKYRNGDRPNRVTTSGYWKATGADRMIKGESSRPIGLKKTLVFYYGKAPKGVRTCWIMNEYRLPHNDSERTKKAEISLCRVYKRAGIADHNLPGTISSKPSSSAKVSASIKKQRHLGKDNHSHRDYSSDEKKIKPTSPPLLQNSATMAAPLSSTTTEDDNGPFRPARSLLNTFSSSMPAAIADELSRVAGYSNNYFPETPSQLPSLITQSQLSSLSSLPPSHAVFTDKIWEWNPSVPDSYSGFKG